MRLYVVSAVRILPILATNLHYRYRNYLLKAHVIGGSVVIWAIHDIYSYSILEINQKKAKNSQILPVFHNKLAVANLLAGLEPALAQPHSSLQFIVVHTIIPDKIYPFSLDHSPFNIFIECKSMMYNYIQIFSI